MKHFQFQTMRIFYFVFNITKTLCKRYITNDTSPTPTCMATIGTKGCQTVRVRSGKCEQASGFFTKTRPITRPLSVRLWVCTCVQQENWRWKIFSVSFAITSLLSMCGCRTSWHHEKRKKKNQYMILFCYHPHINLPPIRSELCKPKVKLSIQACCIFFSLILIQKKKFKIKAIS